ncbi:MAG: hypothetical protein ABIG42_10880 [bacterium]
MVDDAENKDEESKPEPDDHRHDFLELKREIAGYGGDWDAASQLEKNAEPGNVQDSNDDNVDSDNSDKHRLDYFETGEVGELRFRKIDIATRVGIFEDIEDRIDDTLPPGEYKPWDIIIDRKTHVAYGFSNVEFSKWQEEDEKNLVNIECGSCGEMIRDNPFVGFKFCPICNAEISVLKDLAERVIEMRKQAFNLAKINAPVRKGFMTCPLDIPGKLLASLALPDFKYKFTNYPTVLPQLCAFLVFMIGFVFFASHATTLKSINLAFNILYISVVLNVIAVVRSFGIIKITLTKKGVVLWGTGKSSRIRFSRIRSIRVFHELSLIGSIKQQNPVMMSLTAPFMLLIFILTAGLVNLFSFLHDKTGTSPDDSDFDRYIEISTRGLKSRFRVNRELDADLSRLLGVMIYMSSVESVKVDINSDAYFAAQRILKIS